jgi:hypothetical protein
MLYNYLIRIKKEKQIHHQTIGVISILHLHCFHIYFDFSNYDFLLELLNKNH